MVGVPIFGCGGNDRNNRQVDRDKERLGFVFVAFVHPVNDSSTRFPSVAGITSRLAMDNRRLGACELAHTA